MLLSGINQYHCVLILNCFINNKGGKVKKVVFRDYLVIGHVRYINILNITPRLSGQTSIFGVVSFVSKSLMGIERQ